MPTYHLCTSNYTEEKYTGKHVELIVAQDASTDNSLQNRKITSFHTNIYR